MKIPMYVMVEAFGSIYLHQPYHEAFEKQAQVIAEWARKEALKDAEYVVTGAASVYAIRKLAKEEN